MKSWIPLLVLFVFASLNAVTKEEKATRKPNNDFYAQVQSCEGTEALGNEGQGVGVSAMINVYIDPNGSNQKKCELGLAYGYEYGNSKGLKIGRHQPYNVFAVNPGKTECVVKEENGQLLLTVTRAVRPGSKRAGKVLVENCKVTDSGY